MRKWMAYNSEFLEEEEIVRITNDEYVPVRRDDLDGRVDIDLGIATQEDNAAKVQELSFLLQTIGPGEDPAIRREIMADIYELSRMPDQAKKIREYQPQPDPMAEQAKQLELQKLMLENEVLKATIEDKLARANENEIDAQLKMNKAAVEAAKARKLGSEADMKDLEFIDKDNGFKEQYLSEEKEKERQHQLMLAEFQRRAGDQNIGMAR